MQQSLRDAKAAKTEADASGEETLSEASSREIALVDAVLCRVRYRRALMTALLQLIRPSAKAIEAAKKPTIVAIVTSKLGNAFWDVAPPEEHFADEIAQLVDMGFSDFKDVVWALQDSKVC